MSQLLHFLRSFFPPVEPQHLRDDAYFAGAADIRDLERRMREVDRRGRDTSHDLMLARGIW